MKSPLFLNRTGFAAGLLFVIVSMAHLCIAQEADMYNAGDQSPWERLGLSQTEWKKIQDAHIPPKKVEELLKAGIDINDYIAKPWIEIGISEQSWINKRRAGMQDEDMKKTKVESSEGGAIAANFFLPGLGQWQRKQFVRAPIMSLVAVATLGWFAYALDQNITKKNNTDYVIPLMLLFGDMGWSAVDLMFTMRKENNPDSDRFSQSGSPGIELRYTFDIPQ